MWRLLRKRRSDAESWCGGSHARVRCRSEEVATQSSRPVQMSHSSPIPRPNTMERRSGRAFNTFSSFPKPGEASCPLNKMQKTSKSILHLKAIRAKQEHLQVRPAQGRAEGGANELAVLAVVSCEGDLVSLKLVLQQDRWSPTCAHSYAEAAAFLLEHAPSIVVSEARLPDEAGEDPVTRLVAQGHPAGVMVIGRTADEKLWRDVLAFGGHGGLERPSALEDVAQGVQAAWQHCKSNGRGSGASLRR
jgi:DNA-binding NarL/FixJ family response regulator